jgi:hypothetical protein
MSGDNRLNRNQKPARSKVSLTIILLTLFAAAGIATTLVLSLRIPLIADRHSV